MNEYAPNDSIIRGQAKPQVDFQKHSKRPDNLFVNEGKQFLGSMLLESYPVKSKDNSLSKLDKLTATMFNVSKRKILHKEIPASTIDLVPRERLYDPEVFSKKKSVKLVRDFSKQKSRDDMLLNQTATLKNIELENTKEEREKEILDRKKNREKYRQKYSQQYNYQNMQQERQIKALLEL
jgi:hypothetical protein